jgi:hypothetical protein
MKTGKANNDQEGGRRTRKAPAQAKGLSLLGADEISQPTGVTEDRHRPSGSRKFVASSKG